MRDAPADAGPASMHSGLFWAVQEDQGTINPAVLIPSLPATNASFHVEATRLEKPSFDVFLPDAPYDPLQGIEPFAGGRAVELVR